MHYEIPDQGASHPDEDRHYYPPGSRPGMISLPRTPAINPTIIQTIRAVSIFSHTPLVRNHLQIVYLLRTFQNASFKLHTRTLPLGFSLSCVEALLPGT